MPMQDLKDNEALALGIQQFNSAQFFDCHETLEHLWMHDKSAHRELIQGIIQVAVGYYHYARNNRVGALKLLNRGLERIKKFEPDGLHLNICKFSLEISANIDEIEKSDQTSSCAPLNLPIIEVLPD